MKDLDNLRKYSKAKSPFLAFLWIGIASLIFAIFQSIFGKFDDAVKTGFSGQLFIFFALYFKHLDICKFLLKEIDTLKEKKNSQPETK